MSSQPISRYNDAESILLGRLHSIARQQIARSRRRLGEMTEDQQSAVEGLLISTVERIYEPVFRRIHKLHEDGMIETASTWITLFDNSGCVEIEK